MPTVKKSNKNVIIQSIDEHLSIEQTVTNNQITQQSNPNVIIGSPNSTIITEVTDTEHSISVVETGITVSPSYNKPNIVTRETEVAIDQITESPVIVSEENVIVLELQIANTIGGGGGSAVSKEGWVKISDVSGQGSIVITDKTYQDSPNNTVLQSCTASGYTITLSVKSSYPIVKIGSTSYTLTQSADGGHYSGNINHTVVNAPENVVVTVITPDGNNGATDTIYVGVVPAPQILTFSFVGGYPGSQTELKAGDTFQLTGTLDRESDAIEVQNYGASSTTQVLTFPSGTSFTVTMVIGDRGTTPQSLVARARARGTFSGGYGDTSDTSNTVTLCNLYPTVTFGPKTYPVGQSALKGVESASVSVTLLNLDTVLFNSPTSELYIANPNTIESLKTVTRITGNYNITVNNLRATATRVANGAVTVTQTQVAIAAVAASITVQTPADRLRSGGNDGTSIQNHTITILSNQNLLSVSMGASSGTFIGSWVGGPLNWTRVLQVHDNNAKGVFNWINLVATGLAGIQQTVIGSGSTYVVAGFVKRTVSYQAFQTTSDPVNVSIFDEFKISAGLWQASDNQSVLVHPLGTVAPPELAEGYSPSAAGAKPHTVEWLDLVRASSNTGVTYLYDYEELA